MNDILPPKRPLNPNPQRNQLRSQALTSEPHRPSASTTSRPKPVARSQQPALASTVPPPPAPRKRSFKKKILWIVCGFVALLLILVGVVIAWYVAALQPVNAQNSEKISVQIAEGSSPGDIARLLENQRVIRSGLAFEIYLRLEGVRDQLQAGTYNLSPSESVEQIVTHLTSGNVDMLTITFLPGATLAENRHVLLKAGFTEAEVDTALNKQYTSPLFASKPAGSDLEGYLYGETYTFDKGVSVEEILERTFTEYWRVIEENNLVAGFQAQGLNLFEGITLASIVQREDGNPTYQTQVAQVFLRRLEIDMTLGSDVTYYYGAQKLGVEPSSDLDSPYNTRVHTGLPPGPISNPGLSALKAVANPAEGDYLYFISGDDDVLYLAHTNEEHEANVQQHCAVKCQLP